MQSSRYNYIRPFNKTLKDISKKRAVVINANFKSIFESIKEEFIQSIEEHPVSFYVDGHGPLFGLMGFNEDDQPVKDLINFLIVKIKYTMERGDGLRLNFKIRFPTKRDYRALTPLAWTNKSWIEMVEDGVENVPFFWLKEGQGRSQEGFQNKTKSKKPFNFKGQPYISSELGKFKKNLTKALRNELTIR